MTLTHRAHRAETMISSDRPQQFGRFLLVELLSDDVESHVYRAIHQRLRKQVVLKLLVCREEDEAQLREQHLRECRVLCQLLHPNLVRVETAGEHEGTLYVVMEFVAGVDLQKLRVAIGSLTLADACQLTAQAAMGLSYLHEKGLTHGRIRLENFVLTPSGQLKMVGLGQTRNESFQAEIANDLRNLVNAFCELLRWEDSSERDTLPPDLADMLQQLTSDQTRYSKNQLHEFIEIVTRLSVGSDLHSLLIRLDIRPEASSNDSLVIAPSDHLADRTSGHRSPPRTQNGLRHLLVLVIVLVVGIGAALVGSNRWKAGTTVLSPLNSSTSAEPGLSDSRDASKEIVAEFATTVSDWHPPETSSSTHDLHHPVDQNDKILGSIVPDRDAFDLQVRSTDNGTEFENLEARGIVQFPLIMSERYTLACTIERLEGEGSLGFGFSAGEARMMAILDHKSDDQWQSGMYFVGSDGKSGVLEPYSEQFLIEGTPKRLRLVVSPEHVEFTSADIASVDSPAGRVSGWTKSIDELRHPSLGKADAFYPQTFFVHTYRGAFRVHNLQILDASADLVPQPFEESETLGEKRLAQRIVWRGGHVEIITETGTRTVHRLQDLSDDPWLTGVEKCPSAARLMIGDAELNGLTKINGIRKLDLTDSRVTADGLATVNGLRSLAFLALPRHGIDGSVLASLRDLPALRQLQLIGVVLDDDDVDELARFPKLTSLCLSGCPITDTAVMKVTRSFPELEHLCLSGTKITGDCLSELASLGALKDLQLHETVVGDDAIDDLRSLPQLQKLTLHGTRVSATAIDQLRQERPGLDIK